VRFVIDNAALGQVFSENFGSSSHSFHRILHTHHHPSSGASKIGQKVADVPSALSLALPPKTRPLMCGNSRYGKLNSRCCFVFFAFINSMGVAAGGKVAAPV
jgi:hypothetical protein